MSAISFATDVGALAVFDPEVLAHRARAPKDWWRDEPLHAVAEVADGRCALLSIGREGGYRVRLAPTSLTEDEQARAVGVVGGLGLTVTSGEVFVGAADRLPGAGFGERISHIPDTGAVVQVAPGAYAVSVHVLVWRDDDACFDDDGEPRPDAPADFVVALAPREAPQAPPEALPDLLELLPRVEAKGQAKVGRPPARRRGAPEVGPRRRRSPQPPAQASIPRAPRPVAEEVAPYDPEQVRAAFREVLYGGTLHPPEVLGLQGFAAAPLDRSLLRHEVAADALCKKFTRVREQLRTLEQKVNGCELDVLDKVALQAPITATYQALDGLFDYLASQAPSG